MDAADDGDVLVLGARSLVNSDALRSYIRTQAGSDAARVHPQDATSLIDLVETGSFLFDRQQTQEAVDALLHDAAARTPDVKAVTLSSTHLPWLRDYMTAACPTMRLLDRLDDVIARLGYVTTVGTGTTIGLVTQTMIATFARESRS